MKNDYPRMEIPKDLRRRMIDVARQFRKEPTQSEKLLWHELRGRKVNHIKFRRQQPIGSFVVDFYAPSIRLVIEVDGSIHDQQIEADFARQEILELLGLKVLRLSAYQVENDISACLEKISSVIKELVID
jgi:very-short-patch-repair endonuclease